MKKVIVKAIYSLMLFITLVVSIFLFLLTTTPGLYTSIRIAKLFFPGHLALNKVNGRLLDAWQIESLDYQTSNFDFHLQGLTVQWKLNPKGQIDINWLHADSLTVKTLITSQVFSDISLTGTITPQDFHLDSLEFNYLDHKFKAYLQANPLQLNGDVQVNPIDKKNSFIGKLNFQGNLKQLQYKGELQGPAKAKFEGNLVNFLNEGQFKLTLDPGQYKLPENSFLPMLNYLDGQLKAKLSPQGFKAFGFVRLEADKKIQLNLNLPGLALDKGFSSSQALEAEIKLTIPSLEFLNQFSPDIQHLKGQLTALLTAKGPLSKISYQNQILLDKASFNLPALGLHFDTVELKAKGVGKNWEAQGFLASTNHKLIIQGKGPLKLPLAGDLSLKGENFPLISTREYKINVTPKLNLKLNPNYVDIAGNLFIPSAQIEPQTFTNSLVLPDEVVYKNKKEAPATLLNTKMAINVELGDEVHLTLKGLKALLNGKLTLNQNPQGPINATGELSVTKGQYKFYGQDLEIEQGQLLFTGGPVVNPALSLRASKKITLANSAFSAFDINANQQQASLSGPIKAGVEVSGKLTSPNIQLFANPSIYSQADIMSLLILGLPASQASASGGGQFLITALSSVNLGNDTNGAKLIEQVKKISGLDVNIQTTKSYNPGNPANKQFSDNTALVITKVLNKWFSLQVTSSTVSSGIDIIYSKSGKT